MKDISNKEDVKIFVDACRKDGITISKQARIHQEKSSV